MGFLTLRLSPAARPGLPFALLLAAAAYVPSTLGHPGHSLLAGAAAASAGMFLYRRGHWRIPAWWPLPLFLLVWSAGGLFFTADLSVGVHDWTNLAAAALVFLAAAQVLPENPEAQRVVWAGIAVTAGVRVAETLLYIALGPGRPPVIWGAANHNFLSFVWVTGGLAAAAFWKPAPLWRRALHVVLAAVAFGLILRWNLRGALVAGVVGAAAAALAATGRKRWLWAAFGAGGLVLFFTIWAGAPAWLQNNPKDPARLERLVIWQDAMRQAADLPLGTGLGGFETEYRLRQTLAGWRAVQYAHNEYIQILCDLGVPGAAAAFAFIGLLLFHAARRAQSQPWLFALLSVSAGWALFDFMWHGDFPLYLLAVAGGASVPWRQGRPGPARPAALLFGAVLSGAHLIQGLALWQHGRGKAALAEGRRDVALERLERASGYTPWDAHLLYDQAMVLRELGRNDEAEARLRHALRLKPQDVNNRRALTKMRLAANDVEGARAVYAPNLQWAPRVPQVWKEMADLHRWAGDEDSAARCLERFETLLKAPLAPAKVLPKNP